MKYLAGVLYLFFLVTVVSAQDVHQELEETVPAEVIRILSEETRDIIGTNADAVVQTVQVQIKGGEKTGEVATFETDLMKLEVGDRIYVNRLVSIDGVEYFEFKDADRTIPLILLAILFAGLLLGLAGMHGFRALLSLALSIGVILFVLVPLLLAGYPPALTSVIVAGIVLAGALFLTHGIHAQSVIAFTGTFAAVIITSMFAGLFVALSHLTGLSSDEAIYLNFSTKGTLDFGGLLLGSILIGIIGILDDVAITQASVVRELKCANSTLPIGELYMRALHVGRDHMSSLVNTLAFAYVGAALPLVLLLAQAGSSVVLSINQEIVAAELIRIFVGSIGLIIAVPLTTLIAAFWYASHTIDENDAKAHHRGHSH
jgi:uncharacterized membrane protein